MESLCRLELSILGQHFERSMVMRRACGFCLAVALGVGLGRMSSGRLQQAEAGGGSSLPSCSATNGDVNTDGKVDVSDALAVVQFLFLGEPELLQPQCPTALLPGVHTPGRFIVNGDGTVTDTATRLMWEQNKGPSGRTWQDADNYCAALTLAGHDDWRLPTIWELFSVIQFESVDAMDPAFDFETGENGYWSSTGTWKERSNERYVIDFGQNPSNGRLYFHDGGVPALVRPVRKAQ